MSLRHYLAHLRKSLRTARRNRRLGPSPRRLRLELLEARTLLSVSLSGVPNWIAEGPAPNTNGQDENVPAEIGGGPNAVSGAIEAIAVNPGDSKNVFVGGVNGGVWETHDITANPVAWTPLTDQFPALEISALQFDPTDATNQTIVAGIGNTSNIGTNLGPLTGLLETTDGGATWTQLGNSPLASGGLQGEGVSAVGSRGNSILVGVADGPSPGLYRSSDGGASFQLISGLNSLNAGPVFDVAADPSNTSRFYVAVGGGTGGVFRTDDLGNSWTNVTNAAIGALIGFNTSNVKLAVSAAAPNTVYLGINNNGQAAGVFWSNNQGAAWNQMDLPQTLDSQRTITNATNASPIVITVSANEGYQTGDPVRISGVTGNTAANGDFTITAIDKTDFALNGTTGNGAYTGGGTAQLIDGINHGRQGFPNFTLAADPTNANLVYIAGDRQDFLGGDSSIGANNFTARIFRGDSSIAPGGPGAVPSPQWTPLTNSGTSNNSSPHADSRAMVIDSGQLLYSGDGGLFEETRPTTTTGVWLSKNGAPNGANNGIQVTQFSSNISYDSLSNIIFGGAQDTGTPQQSATGSQVYQDQTEGDGPFTAVDDLTSATQSARYIGFGRQDYDAANNPVPGTKIDLIPMGGVDGLTGFDALAVSTVAPPAGQSAQLIIANGRNPMQPGVRGLFDSTNAGIAATTAAIFYTQIPTGAGWGGVNTFFGISALAVGGMLNGTANQDVLYAGSGTQVFLRSTAGGTLTATAGQPAGAGFIQAIAIDPNNWRTAYVTDGSQDFQTTNAGASWTNITGNLNDNNIHSITVADSGAGVSSVLVGETDGVFRMLSTAPGVWTKFGANSPNSSVWGVQYSAAQNVLVAGTSGRGAFEVQNAGATLFTQGVLQINGDTDFAGENDTIKLVLDPNNPLLLDVFLDSGSPVAQVPLASLTQINVNGLGGNDTLIVDSSNGLISVPNGINYDGGNGFNALQLVQTDGTTQTSDTYSVGPNPGMGTSVITGPSGTQTVFFQNLAPVLDTVAAFSLTVNATPADNAIDYSVGSVPANGLVTIDDQESIEFANKVGLTINGGSGTDAINLNNAFTPNGLAGIAINGGDPGSGDTLTISGAGVAVSVNTATSTIIGATGAAGAVPLSYSGIEALNLAANIGDLTLTTTSAADTLSVTPGVSGAANDGSLVSSGVVPSITFANSGTLTADLDGGNDSVNVTASANDDTIAVSDTAVAIAGRNAVNYTGAESVTVSGLAGNDTFNVTSSATVPISIDGGDPTGVLPGDLLNVVTNPGDTVAFNPGPTGDQGSVLVNSNQPISFVHIESLEDVNGAGAAVINGTGGNDVIAVAARDGSYNALADGVQDFTVSVDNAASFLFLNTPSLAVHAGAGDDQITVQAPAPNLAAWNVAVTADGGSSAAVGDQLVVAAPGQDQATYAPASANSGRLGVADSNGPVANVTLTDIESFIYDGQAGGDTFTMVGTPGANAFTLTPGAANDAGALSMDSTLPVTFQNLGASGQVVVNGNPGLGADSLVYNGTMANDGFTINSSASGGQVNLNARVPVLTQNIPTLSLEGLAGDDTFTLVPTIGGTNPYRTLNLDGGATAAATGNQANLTAAANAALTISGQVITQNGHTVAGTSLQNINLDGAGNAVTYNGIAGVTEYINVIASPTANQGQVSVPGVALWTFVNVPIIDVNGNTADNDTLTFTGTNQSETYNINTAAAGTTADPILQLFTTGLTPLLVLRNYTGFSTLNVSGLDGADTFNVHTGPATGRNLFINGNVPSGKKKLTDVLNVFYIPPRPKIIQSAATQNPTSGLVEVIYSPTSDSKIEYAGIENVTIKKQ